MNPQSKPASDERKPKKPLLRWILVLLAVLLLGQPWSGVAGSTSRSSTTPRTIRPHPPMPSPSSEPPNTTAIPRPSSALASITLNPSTAAASPRSSSPSAATAATSISEGAVGQQYLEGAGVPESDIIAETESTSTDQSVRRLAVIARTNGLHRIVVVSDGTHLFRIHQICAANGLDVLTSPRPRVPIEGNAGETERMEHEILSYTLWRLHLD